MKNENSPPPTGPSPALASELNNLLQIISGTSALIENIWEGNQGADKYFEMLRESVARAAQATTQLVTLSGEVNTKIVMHPDSLRKPPPASAPAPRLESRRKRLLLVDDEKMLLILTGEMLREAGYEVVTAQSGFECLDLFRAAPRRFDLVLLDLSMPLMDGEETFHRLRALRPDVQVMLCTGYVHRERLNHMLAEGLCGFLQKPVSSEQYLSAIRGVFQAAAARSILPAPAELVAAS